MKNLALFDIDGVLADDRHRLHHALNKDWGQYFSEENMAADSTHPQGITSLLNLKSEGWEIAYLTGRREDTREVTEGWLTACGFPKGAVFMRPLDVKIPLALLKLAKMQEIIATGAFDSIVLMDDDPEVIRVITDTLGSAYASHCTWSVKPSELVKTAVV